MQIHAIVPTPTPIPDDTWQRARGNQRYRERQFVQSGRERARLIANGTITPKNKKAK
jgi:hypothetical protein